MARALAIAVLLTTAFAGAGRAATPAKVCGDQLQFGYLSSLLHTKGHWQLRFDPALFTSGVTANAAAGQQVPNDNYVVNESKRTYLFYVSPTAHVTVLTPKHNVDGAPVSVATLAQLVAGKHPVKLFEPFGTGFWMRYHIDTACDVRQQYHP